MGAGVGCQWREGVLPSWRGSAVHEYLISAYFGRRLVGSRKSEGGRLEPGLSSDSGSATDSSRLVV